MSRPALIRNARILVECANHVESMQNVVLWITVLTVLAYVDMREIRGFSVLKVRSRFRMFFRQYFPQPVLH